MTFQKLITFGIALLGAVAGCGVLLLLNPWEPLTVGEYTARRNRVTGVAELRVGDRWTRFEDDLRAAPIPPERVSRLRVEALAWGPDGILCGKVYNRLADPVRGRLSFRIVFRNVKDKRFVRDRSLRATVDFPPMASTPFILRTNLRTPDPATTTTEVEFEPVAASGL
jgi:hypothetical protein